MHMVQNHVIYVNCLVLRLFVSRKQYRPGGAAVVAPFTNETKAFKMSFTPFYSVTRQWKEGRAEEEEGVRWRGAPTRNRGPDARGPNENPGA